MIPELFFNITPFPIFHLTTVSLINVVGLLLIVTIVTRNSFRDNLTSVFAVMSGLMLTWIDFAYLARVAGKENLAWAELFLRAAWVATPPFFAYVYLITVHILHREKQLKVLNIALVLMSLVLGAVTAFTDYIIQGVTFSGSSLDIVYGKGFYPFLGIISLYIIATLFPIFTTKVEEYRKKRVRAFLVGVSFFYLANLIFNITLPAFLGVTHLYYFGDYSLAFLVGFTAYAIIRHRLLDIRTIIFRAVGFTMLTGLFFVLYGALTYAAIRFVDQFALGTLARAILGVVNAVLAIPAFYLFRFILRNVTDRFLFQGRVNYRRELVGLSEALSGTIQIEEVVDIMLRAMKNIVRARKAIILLWDEERLEFAPHANYGAQKFDLTLPTGHPIMAHIRKHRGTIVKDEERIAFEAHENPLTAKEQTQTLNAFEWLDVSVILPFYVNKELTAILLLGDKLSGEQYNQDDVEFLNALAPQAATALENARLYKQAQEFNVRLRKEVEDATRELEDANIQLKNLDKAKSEFLSIASHQLYTPLTALRGYISMMKDGDFGKVPEKQAPVLDILEKSASRLIELIKNLLDVSRIESGRLELKLESTDLSEMTKELVADLMPNALSKKLKLEFHAPTSPVANVVVDQERVRQVMLNFIDNAIKYTTIGRIDVHVYQKGEYVVFAVQDTGKGIKRDDIARLFNKFMRVGGASRFHTEGTGLGLYVARQIVREHHGEVHVDSPGEGQGSTFTMQLPAEGTSNSLKPGQTATVDIKAAEAQPTAPHA